MGKHGSIAVVERLILTMKTLLACLLLVPYRRERFRRELAAIVEWYNEYRPHSWLGGRTPNEVYHGRYPANRRPRFEPRTAMMRIPAQIIRADRRIVYRLLAWNPWQHVFFRLSINSVHRCVAEDATLKPESGCSGPKPRRTAPKCNRNSK